MKLLVFGCMFEIQWVMVDLKGSVCLEEICVFL